MIQPNPVSAIELAEHIRVLDQNTGETQPWMLYPHQQQALHTLCNNTHVIVLKARQLGYSTLVAYYYVLLGIANPGARIAVVADKWANSNGLLQRIGSMLKDLGIPATIENQREIAIGNGSAWEAITVNTSVGTENTAGRSRTYHALFLSEAAYYNKSTAVFASLTSATIPDAHITLESTATPGDTVYRRLWEGDDYTKTFTGFEDHPHYIHDPQSLSDERWTEYQGLGGTSRPHGAFWYWKLDSAFGGDRDRLLREYPLIPLHSWISAEGRWIPVDPPIIPPKYTKEDTQYWHDPLDGHPYIAGIDVAAGGGRDSTVCAILRCDTKELVALYRTNTTAIDAAAGVIRSLTGYYRVKAIYCESNGIGEGMISHLRGLPTVPYRMNEANLYQTLLWVRNWVIQGGGADTIFQQGAANLSRVLKGNREGWSHPPDDIIALGIAGIHTDQWAHHPVVLERKPGSFYMDNLLGKGKGRRW